MKVVVYLRADDERALAADGHDPAEWAREQVKLALRKRALMRRKERATEARGE